MEESTVRRVAPSVDVKAWERPPGIVLEVAIGRTMSLEEMEEIARLTGSTVKLLLRIYPTGRKS